MDEEGYVIGYDLLASDSRYFSKAAINLIGSMPKWNPALRKGKAVASSYIVPIPFSYEVEVADSTAVEVD